MAMIPELQEYTGKISKEAAALFEKITRDMTEQQQKEFLASVKFQDQDFVNQMMMRLPEGTPEIDPTSARLKAFPKEAGVGPRGLNLQGKYVSSEAEKPSIERYRGDDGKIYELEFEPGTVSAVEPINARADIFAHEYRHKIKKDGSELTNRVQDLMASQNKREFIAGIESLADGALGLSQRLYFRGGDPTEDQKKNLKQFRDLYNKTVGDFESDEEMVETAKALLDSQLVKDMMFLFRDEVPDPRRSLFYKAVVEEGRKVKDAPQVYKGGGAVTELPKGYREGGRTRLI